MAWRRHWQRAARGTRSTRQCGIRRDAELARTAEKEKLGIMVSAMDVDSDSSVAEAIGKIYANGGRVDVLVNNAGVEYIGTVEETPLNVFRSIMETNYFGVLRCTKAVAPRMRAQKSGHIINVSSVAGRISSCAMSAYAASKWALEGLSEALAQEMKPANVRVSLVEPGVIATSMAARIGEGASPSTSNQARRWTAFFAAALKDPAPASVVAETILELIDGGSWTLRHPTGPSAVPFLQWRGAMNDEQWVEWGALEDDAWYQRVKKDFGIDARGEAAKA